MKKPQNIAEDQVLPALDKSELFLQEYIKYVLENGKQPSTVYQFTKSLGFEEKEFYEYFNSFNAIERLIWKGFIDQTIDQIESEEIYNQYTVREKFLAFYFTIIETFKNNRSFIIYSLGRFKKTDTNPEVLKDLKEQFIYFANELLNEAKETDEIVNRTFISERYQDGLWLQFLFVLNFWIKDNSQKFEKTDAAIEKAVHLSFDLMGKSPLDTMIDFAKFLYQNK